MWYVRVAFVRLLSDYQITFVSVYLILGAFHKYRTSSAVDQSGP